MALLGFSECLAIAPTIFLVIPILSQTTPKACASVIFKQEIVVFASHEPHFSGDSRGTGGRAGEGGSRGGREGVAAFIGYS